MTIAGEVAKILLKIQAIDLRPNKPFRFTSGILSPVYSDIRLIMSYPKERTRIVELLSQVVKKIGKPDFLAGTATAAIPHAAFLAQKLNLPMVYVRSKPKAHGKQTQVEGTFKKGQKALVIEDLISTGKSSIETAQGIRSAGGKTNTILSIFDYTMPQSAPNFKSAKLTLFSLVTFPVVVDIAISKKYMKAKDRELVLEWLKNPPEWGKKMGFG